MEARILLTEAILPQGTYFKALCYEEGSSAPRLFAGGLAGISAAVRRSIVADDYQVRAYSPGGHSTTMPAPERIEELRRCLNP